MIKRDAINDKPETFWSWLAGFTDGDGCIGVYSSSGYPSARVSFTQKERLVLDYIVEQVGSGSVHSSIGQTTFGGQTFNLSFGSAASRELCRRMMPYLVTKRAAAERAIASEGSPDRIKANASSRHPKYTEIIEGYKAGKSAWLLSQETGVKDATILYWVRTLGISRSYSEAQQLRRQNEARA